MLDKKAKANRLLIAVMDKMLPILPTDPTKYNFEQSEQARKIRLVQVLNLIMILVHFNSAVFYIGFWLAMKSTEVLLGAGVSLILIMCLLINARLKTARHYQLKAWVVIFSSLILVIYACWLAQTSLNLMLVFMLPLALALALLSYRDVLVVAGFITVVSIGWYANSTWLNWFEPIIIVDPQMQAISNIAIILFTVPSLVALLLIPARSQLKMVHTQNQRLVRALEQLQVRQQTGQTVSQQVLAVASQLTTTATQQASGSQEQAAVVVQVDSSLSELSATAISIAELADQVNQAAHTVAADSSLIQETAHLTARQSQEGLNAVQETVSVTSQSASLYEQLVNTMDELNDKNGKLRQILDLLGSIAGETHLLSLNASIEAASAGEYGQRFGVIAQEVKRLAQRSATANQEVLGIVGEIETATNSAVRAAQHGYQHARQVETIAHRTGTMIAEMGQIAQLAQLQSNSINQASHEVEELTQVIWAATSQQRIASQQVLEALKGLSQVAEQSAEGSSLISTTANELEELSQHLSLALVAAA